MKLIIDIPDKVYSYITKELSGLKDDNSDSILLHLVNGVINSKPYEETQGDLISRSYLKQMIPTPIEDEYKYVHQIIDNAPTVEDSYSEGYSDGYLDGMYGCKYEDMRGEDR